MFPHVGHIACLFSVPSVESSVINFCGRDFLFFFQNLRCIQKFAFGVFTMTIGRFDVDSGPFLSVIQRSGGD